MKIIEQILDIPIIDGWIKKFSTKHPCIQTMFSIRYKKCLDCPFRKQFVGKDLCTKCGCPLASKLLAYKAECPIKKWGKIDVIGENDNIILKENNIIIYNGPSI